MADKKRGPGRPAGSKNKNSNSKGTTGKRSNNNTNSKAKAKAMEIQAKKKADKRVIDEIWAIITIAIGVFLIVATFTKGAGQLGDIVGAGLKGLFGFMAYILPFYLIVFGILLFAKQTTHFSLKTLGMLFVILLMLCTMNSIRFMDLETIKWSWSTIKDYYITGQSLLSGGFFGMLISSAFIIWLGKAGTWILTLVVTMILLLLLINTPLSRFVEKIADKIEERKLIRANSHLDEYYEETFESNSQSKLDPIAYKSNFSKTDNSANNTSAKVEKRKPLFAQMGNNILKYMSDEELFDRNGQSNGQSTGLEEASQAVAGFGIDGNVAAMGEKTVAEPNMPIFNEPVVPNINVYDKGKDVGQADFEPKYEAKSNQQVSMEAIPNGTLDKEVSEKLSKKEAREAMLTTEEMNNVQIKQYIMPDINLLEPNKMGNNSNSSALKLKAAKLEETLASFNVDARILQVTQGPTVTRYEIQPAIGVKVSKIVSLADDIALNLEAKSIRIEAPIPGKAAVGIEVENDSVTMVRLREIIDSANFKNSKSKITFAVGKDISGNAIVADLKAMPHMLIAGSTGSGKSVCINSIITSILYKANPDEVKMILIDPKVVELGNYNGIPHLLIPVVTDPTKAAAALNWAVAEMTERYKKFAENGVKDLESYNEYMKAEGEAEKVMPQVVIIIDELADLMMAAPSQIEESICRLAQMARAAGMHLIVATQRPSVDVITGVIKANIPSRIAFAVSSQVDSRTILDMAGAEKLVGKGDMLFNPMGMGKPIRVQGTFLSENEVNKVITYVKSQVQEESPKYNEDVISKIERSHSQESPEDTDELLSDAVELVVRSGQASVSMLQRRFRIGYNRAARIMDMLEARQVVGAQDGSRPRQVLMTIEEFEMDKETLEEE